MKNLKHIEMRHIRTPERDLVDTSWSQSNFVGETIDFDKLSHSRRNAQNNHIWMRLSIAGTDLVYIGHMFVHSAWISRKNKWDQRLVT